MSPTTKQTELGKFMRRWRDGEGLTVEGAAVRTGIVKSTWSNIERGVRRPGAETLLLIERSTGVEMAELARMSGYPTRKSDSSQHRAQRVAAMAEGMPLMGALLDTIQHLRVDQVDTLLSLAEDMDRQNKGLPRRQKDA